jgi:hypothetical protein
MSGYLRLLINIHLDVFALPNIIHITGYFSIDKTRVYGRTDKEGGK